MRTTAIWGQICLCVILTAVGGLPASAEENLLPNAVAKILKNNSLSSKNTGLYLAWADGTPVAMLNLDRPFNPASSAKMITSMVALEMLGANYTWKSRLLASAPVVDGSLRGDLYWQGGGDPFMTNDRFWHLVGGVVRRGIRDIAGDIVVDDTLFELAKHDPAAFDGKGNSLYNAAPGAAVVNFGASKIILRADHGVTTVFMDPPSTNFILDNKLRRQNGRCTGNWRARIGERLERFADGSAKLALTGRFPSGCKEQSYFMLGQSDPVAHAAGAIGGIFTELGGKVIGGWRREKTPRNARTIAQVESQTLGEALRGMNKNSNNFMARNIFLSIAKKAGRQPYTLEASRKVVTGWFNGHGINTTGLHIDNGSGLSRETQVTPRQFGEALRIFTKSPARYELIASLSVLGRDGTTRKWNRTDKSAGGAHLKTGTLSNARSTVGYVHNPAGDIIFVVLAETRGTALARRAIQELLEWSFRLPPPA